MECRRQRQPEDGPEDKSPTDPANARRRLTESLAPGSQAKGSPKQRSGRCPFGDRRRAVSGARAQARAGNVGFDDVSSEIVAGLRPAPRRKPGLGTWLHSLPPPPPPPLFPPHVQGSPRWPMWSHTGSPFPSRSRVRAKMLADRGRARCSQSLLPISQNRVP